MKSQAANVGQGKRLLMRAAESIGSTLGTIAAKANAIPGLARTLETDSKRPGANKAVPKKRKPGRAAPEHRKLARSSRRASRRPSSGGATVRAARAKSRA